MMNTKKIIVTICSILGLLYILVSCKKETPKENELPYLFRPVGFTATVNKTVATITWLPIDSAKSYTLEISQDSLLFTNIIKSEVVTSTTYIIELAGNTRFSARVKANAGNTEKDSKFNQTLTFKTPAENIFNGYNSYMYDQGATSMAWLPAANATKLVFRASGHQDVVFTIADNEKAAGKKTCTGLANGAYTIGIYNNDILRGNIQITIEGDVWLNKGADVTAGLNGITKDSAVVILRPGIYSFGTASYNFTKNIKIKGLYKDSLTTLCMGGTASATANMFNINTAALNFVRFENIDFTGYLDGITSINKIGYLFNQNTACTVGEISFKNCKLHNLNNAPVRVKITGVTISNMFFDNCQIYEMSFGAGSTYAIISSTVAGSVISNISFSNSTIYNYANSFIAQSASTTNSITIQNCTFNQMEIGTTVRYLIDCNTTNTVTNGVNISNCIFGSTGTLTDGIRFLGGTSLTVAGSYCTNDYIDNHATPTSYTVMARFTPYAGASTALFTSPTTGDFTFKDIAFAGAKTAGDPRWKQ